MRVKKGIFNRIPIYSLLVWAMVIWMVVSTVALIQAQDDDPSLVHTGKRHVIDGELDQAIINFSEHLKLHGFNREAYYWRAHCLIKQHYIEEAIEDLMFLLQYHPDDSQAMDAIGYANNQRGNYLEAIKWFNDAIVHDDKNAVIYNNRGMSYYYLDKFPTAFHDFNKAVRLDSTFAEAYSNRGSARYNNQNIAAATDIDLRKAENDFSIAIDLDNTLVSAYRNRGIIRFHLQKYPESFLDLQKAIYLNPNDAIVYYHMGKLMMAQEQYAEAVNYFGESLKRDPRMTDAIYNRALSHIKLGDLETARYDYGTIIEKYHDQRGECFYLIARTYAMEDNSKLAYTSLKQARKNGYFKGEGHTSKVFNDPLFEKYWDEGSFQKLKEKIKG